MYICHKNVSFNGKIFVVGDKLDDDVIEKSENKNLSLFFNKLDDIKEEEVKEVETEAEVEVEQAETNEEAEDKDPKVEETEDVQYPEVEEALKHTDHNNIEYIKQHNITHEQLNNIEAKGKEGGYLRAELKGLVGE